MTFKRYENETDEELIYRVCSQKDQIGTWQDIADILNELLNFEYTESKYRKTYQAFQKMLNANQSKFAESSAYAEEIKMLTRNLEKAKVQFRDERNAWNKQNYTSARVEQKLDYLEEMLTNFSKVNFENVNHARIKSNNDLYIVLSDLHIGQTFDSSWGKYNSDIAKDRLNQLLNRIIDIQRLHNSENAYVSISGDLLSGNIHKSIQVTNRENVIEQIKIASELITSFCYELSKYFNSVIITNVAGNHSRIDKKEDALHSERLDDLIGWIISNSLSHIDNIEFKDDNIDIGIASVNIRGKEYISVHGDYDTYTSNGVSKLCMMLKRFPYAISYGHLHTCAVSETNGIKMIRGGSLAGSGDSYTIEKRLSGKPSQMVCVCSENGVDCYYPIELD